jgi:hypothetical protein
LEAFWQNEHHQSFYFNQTGRSRPAALLACDSFNLTPLDPASNGLIQRLYARLEVISLMRA